MSESPTAVAAGAAAAAAAQEADISQAESAAHSSENSTQENTGYEEGRITVSVRVRPLNARESKLDVGLCIAALPGYSTIYILPSGESEAQVRGLLAADPQLRGTRHHRFTFDHVYPTDATQEEVYEQIGRPVLESSFRGYHTCIFAYGQTGSGKSYCMMGADGGRAIDVAPGIIPRLCREMFVEIDKRRQAATDSGEEVDFSVYVSYLEIYRERVRSLLDEVHDARLVSAGNAGGDAGAASPRPLGASLRRPNAVHTAAMGDSSDAALRVREHPTLGVYVEGLAEIPVTSEEQVLRLMVRGNQRRHTASTKMNDTSSRSHAIFTLQLLQKRTHTVPSSEAAAVAPEGGGGGGAASHGAPSAAAVLAAAGATGTVTTMTTQLGAKINLVDLAGSERAKATGAEGETLKEGAQINKSLTTLGIVINALAAQSSANAASGAAHAIGSPLARGAAKRHIPYRDSTLTFLLKESLGGNSKTFMIATVSPSADNYDESLSTLRYADRAKAIVMKAFVNETAGDKRIRELEEEVTRLREQIRSLLSAEAQRSSVSEGPVALRDSESMPQPSEPCTVPYVSEDEREARHERHGFPRTAVMEVGAGEAQGGVDAVEPPRGSLEGDGTRGTSPTPSASPSSDWHHEESSAVVVETLHSELRRAEELIRQMSDTQAERDAHVAQLIRRHEEEQAASRAAAAASKEAEKNAASAMTATMRLHREEPYLLNMDGAGDWVVAHLGPAETRVGCFEGHRRGRHGAHDEADGGDSVDSSIALSSRASASSSGATGDAGQTADGCEAVRRVCIPREFGDGIGAPHCVLDRSGSTAAAAAVKTVLRACPGLDTYVMRPLSRTPFVVKGGDTFTLQSGDVLDIGNDHIQLKYMDPAEPPVTARGRRTAAVAPMNAFSVPASTEWTGSDRGASSAGASRASAGHRREAAAADELRQRRKQRMGPAGGADNAADAAGAGTTGVRGGGGDAPALALHDSFSSHSAYEEADDAEGGAEPAQYASDADSHSGDSFSDSESEEMPSPGADQPRSQATTPSAPLSRPVIPALAFGKAFPGSRLSPPPPPAAPAPAVSTHAEVGPADGVAASSNPFESTSSYTGSERDDHETYDEQEESAMEQTTSDLGDTTRSQHTGTGAGGVKGLTFSLPLSRLAPTHSATGAAGAPAAQAKPARPVKTRVPSKRTPQTAHLNPNSALSLSEMQAMRTNASSGTYRSELPPRFVGRYNLLLVGPSGSGKSTLVDNLAKEDEPWLQSAFSVLTGSTRGLGGVSADGSGASASGGGGRPTFGIHTTTITAPGATPMNLHVHELGGTPCFSPLLDQLPSHRVTYLLCFPLNSGPPLMALRGIVEDILCRTDSHTVALVLVGTHAHLSNAAGGAKGETGGLFSRRLSPVRQAMLQRQMEEVELQVASLIQMLQPFPQLRPTIVGRFAVDNAQRQVYATGYRAVESFPELLQWLGDTARDRCKADADFASGLVPARCMELGRQVGLLRERGKWCLSLRDFKALATAVSSQYDTAPPAGADATLARDILRQHMQLLADWGVLAHRFRSTPLLQHVILDVVWLCRLLTTLACCALVATAESDGLTSEEAATLVDVAGERGSVLLSKKEAALRILLTPGAERIVDVVKVATTDTPHLLRYGVLSMPVLVTMLEPHFSACGEGDGAQRGAGAGRRVDNAALNLIARGDPSATDARYAVPLAGVLELLVLCDFIIAGRKLLFSPTSDSAEPASVAAPQSGGGTHNATTQDSGNTAEDEDADGIDPAKESFVVYPMHFRTPATAGVTWLLPCFLSGPFYVFKMDMVPRNFFPKLLCRLATVSDRIYLGPAVAQRWGGPTQRWGSDAARSRGGNGGRRPPAGPFDAYFSECAGKSFVLPRFAGQRPHAPEDGSPRRRDGFWFDAAWLLYRDGARGRGVDDAAGNPQGDDGDDDDGDNCRVLVRLVHHSVFLSFHCHRVATSAGVGVGGGGDAGSASPGVQDFYEAVLEAVRHVVEEYPGGKCGESMQCCVDPTALLEMELRHPAVQSDRETAAMDKYVCFASISDNLNSLERVLAKSGTALRTARTARRSHGAAAAAASEEQGEDENTYVPLLRNFSATAPLNVAECIRRWKTEQHFFISTEVEGRLVRALQELGGCYHRSRSEDASAVMRNSCFALDNLLDVLARVDTA